MSITARLLRYFAFFWILFLCAGTIYQYINFKHDTYFIHLKQAAVATGWYLPAFYCHIFSSSIILLAGFFQFSKTVYNNRPLHKALGKLYVFGVLFFAAPGAYIMTLYINRGMFVFASFFIQNTLWVVFTLLAFLLVRKGKVDAHIKMMHRSYALAFGAVMLRFYIWLFMRLGIGVDFENNYIIISFLSWVPNLILVELINRYNKSPIPLKN